MPFPLSLSVTPYFFLLPTGSARIPTCVSWEWSKRSLPSTFPSTLDFERMESRKKRFPVFRFCKVNRFTATWRILIIFVNDRFVKDPFDNHFVRFQALQLSWKIYLSVIPSLFRQLSLHWIENRSTSRMDSRFFFRISMLEKSSEKGAAQWEKGR